MFKNIFLNELQSFLWKKFTAYFVLVAFFTTTVIPPQSAQAEVLNSSQLVSVTPAYQPAVLQGMVIHPENPLNFDFIMNFGDSNLQGQALQDESQKLVKYFIASLATSEKDMWVNLSPYEPDRIVPQVFGQTEMGRDMLAQDYLLKQITASLMHPDSETGKKFWDKIYQTAYEQYGMTDIPVDTFNKVWIVPQTTTVYENAATNTVFVSESTLDVMLESDYLAQSKSQSAAIVAEGKSAAGNQPALTDQAKQIIKEIVLPALKQEVNDGRNFAPLRQIMNSLILAKWYKDAFQDSILNQEFANQDKTAGTIAADPSAKQKIYEQYVQAFQQGAYDVLREEYDPAKQEVVMKRYFSGGVAASNIRVERAGIPIVNSNNFAMLGTRLASLTDKNFAMMNKSGKILSMPVIVSLVVFSFLSFNLAAQGFIPMIISPKALEKPKVTTTIQKKIVRIHRDLSRPSELPEEFRNRKDVTVEWEKVAEPDGSSYWKETISLPEEILPSETIDQMKFDKGKPGNKPEEKIKNKEGEKDPDIEINAAMMADRGHRMTSAIKKYGYFTMALFVFLMIACRSNQRLPETGMIPEGEKAEMIKGRLEGLTDSFSFRGVKRMIDTSDLNRKWLAQSMFNILFEKVNSQDFDNAVYRFGDGKSDEAAYKKNRIYLNGISSLFYLVNDQIKYIPAEKRMRTQDEARLLDDLYRLYTKVYGVLKENEAGKDKMILVRQKVGDAFYNFKKDFFFDVNDLDDEAMLVADDGKNKNPMEVVEGEYDLPVINEIEARLNKDFGKSRTWSQHKLPEDHAKEEAEKNRWTDQYKNSSDGFMPVIIGFLLFLSQMVSAQNLSVSHSERQTNVPVLEDTKGGIDLEKTNVTRVNSEGRIKINFKPNPALLQELRNATGLRAIINIKPITVPVIKGLLGLNGAQPDNNGFENVQEVMALSKT